MNEVVQKVARNKRSMFFLENILLIQIRRDCTGCAGETVFNLHEKMESI